jgi:hypothetical protein
MKNRAAQPGYAQYAIAWIENRLDDFLAKAWPSYLFVLILQSKVLWSIWSLRDLSSGDTSSYFSTATSGWSCRVWTRSTSNQLT